MEALTKESGAAQPPLSLSEIDLIFNVASEAFCIVGPEGNCRYVNQKFCDIIGYTRDEILGGPVQQVLKPFARDASTYEGLADRDLYFLRKDGRSFPARLDVQNLTANGKPTGSVLFLGDLSEERQLHDVLRKTEKLAAAGRMAGAIAHEINNPLEGVVNLLYLLRGEVLSTTARHYLTLIETEIERVSRIARQTLGFYRASTKPERVDLRELLNMVADVQIARKPNVRVSRRYRNLGPFLGFGSELQQAFHNLIANAVDAGADRLWLHVLGCKEGPLSRDGFRISIADNGSGIQALNLKNLFNPFFTTKGERGTGLGLWVTRGIIVRHEGTITVRTSTTPGRSGTCFSIFLPR